MATTVVRPDETISGASNFTAYGGAASINVALSDDNIATYVKKTVTGNGSVVVGFGTTTIGSSVRVSSVRIRAQLNCPTASSRLRITPICRVAGVNYSGAALSLSGAYATAEYAGAYATTAPDGQPWDQTRITGLRAQIQDNASGADLSTIYELFFDVVTTTQPSVTVNTPTGTVSTTSAPDVAWSFTDTDGNDQAYYQVKVFTAAVYGAAGFNPATSTAAWDSDVVTSADSSVTVGQYLSDATTYRAYVRTAKEVSNQPFWSPWAYTEFLVDVVPPVTPSLTSVYSAVSNSVLLTITGGALTGTLSSQTFQVQRSDDSQSTWADVIGGSLLTVNPSYQASLTDYAAPRAATAYYRVRSIGVSGDNAIVSAWSSSASAVVTNDSKWWFKVLDDPTLNVSSLKVSGGFDGNPDEQIGVFRPLGRSTAVVVTAGLMGEDGGFKISTVGATEFDSVWAAITHLGVLLVQTPEPEQKFIRVIDRQYVRTGKLTNVHNVLTVKYVVVASP